MISILSVFPPYRGGIATFSDYLYSHLQKETEVTAFNFSYLYPRVLFPGKSQFSSDENTPEYAERVLHSCNPFNWSFAAKKIAENNPEHLIICYWHPFFAPAYLKVISEIKEQKPDIKVHLLAHNVVPHESFPFGRFLSKKLINTTDNLILLSQKSVDEAKKLGVGKPITHLFHPVYEQNLPELSKAELRNKYGFDEHDRVFLFFGLIRHYKGLDLFIEALNNIDLEKHHIRPLIVGEFYTEKEPILSKINPGHKHLYTIVDRFVSDEEMAELFTLSDALVMPYRSASQSGILANAINFHLPAIVTNLSGLTEHVDHHKTAWIVSKDDIQQLEKAILSLTDQDTLNELSNELRPLKNQLSWKTFSDSLLQEIRKENP